MKQNDENKRKYLIIGLCALVVLMAVGFAAFSQQLRINGTANITSNWCLGFDKTKLDTYVASKSGSVGQNPTGSMSYSGSMCGTKSQVNAQLSSHLNQPGDSVEYTLTIINEGTFSATIDNVKVGETFISEDTTFTKGNVLFKVDMPANMTIAAGGSTTMKVKATFQNNTDITGTYSGENQGIEVVLNASQGNGGSQGGGSQGGGQSTPSVDPEIEEGTAVYAFHTDNRTVGTTTVTDGVADYTQLSSYQEGKRFFIKYMLDENNVILSASSCFKYDFISEPVCLKGKDKSAYAANRAKIDSLASTFAAQSPSGLCMSDSAEAGCQWNDLKISADRDGFSHASDQLSNSGTCNVHDDGLVYCLVN